MSNPPSAVSRLRTIATCGEALVSIVPTSPVAIEEGVDLHMFVGGAEVNFAIGVRRLGLNSTWIGSIGDDPLGRFVKARLESEGIDTRFVRVGGGSTGLYLREWLADGERRPFYYRKDSAGSRLSVEHWPLDLGEVDWLHVTGITPALSESCGAVVLHAVAWAREHGVAISFDPNYRRQLWTEDEARATLFPILQASRVLLLGVDEAALLLGTEAPDEIARRALAFGVETVVVKMGDRGARAYQGSSKWTQEPFEVTAVDPVGAGDAFDAGFVSALVMGRPVDDALRWGSYCGAKVTEHVGESTGFPQRDDIPLNVIRVTE